MKAKPMGMLWMMPPGWLNRLRDSLAGSSKLLTWCHWLDRNIARVGVAADLEVVKRAGLGGVYLFDCDIGMP